MGQVCPLCPTDSYQLAYQPTPSTDFTSLALVDIAACSIPLVFSTCFHPRQRRVATSSPGTRRQEVWEVLWSTSIQWSRANLPVGFMWIACLRQCLGFECFNQGIWNQYTLLSYWPERNVHLCSDFDQVNSHFTSSDMSEGAELSW